VRFRVRFRVKYRVRVRAFRAGVMIRGGSWLIFDMLRPVGYSSSSQKPSGSK
jgi:hypothetical protein